MVWGFLAEQIGSAAALVALGFVWLLVVGGMFLDDCEAACRRIANVRRSWRQKNEARRAPRVR